MAYDDLDRLVGVTAGSAQGGNAVFAYDVLDNIRQLDQGTRTVRHQYDTVNRLASVKNAAGATVSTYVHDTRGNLIQRITGAVTDTFTFDKANRLRASNIGGVVNSYHYDGLGRRIRLQEGSNISHFFFSQAGQLLYNTEGATALRYNHIYLAGSLVAKRILPAAGGAATVRYQHTDALGSPIHETNESGALVPPSERLTAYGEPADGTWRSGPGFTGHQMDAGAKLVYMQQRYYDPSIGRFLSADPVRTDPNSGQNFNRFQYAANNPYRFVDPDGRSEKDKRDDEKNSICRTKVCVTVQVRQATRKVADVQSRPGESRKDFILRAGKEVRAMADKGKNEVCGEICPNANGGFQIELYTSDSRVVCGRPDACGGDSLHAHGKDGSFRLNRLDSAYLKVFEGQVQADVGSRWPGQNLNQFSPADYEDGAGYLAGKKGVLYQNGEDTDIYIGDYPK